MLYFLKNHGTAFSPMLYTINEIKMTGTQKLILIKIIHTAIWSFFNLILVYLFYASLTDSIDYKFWIGIGIIILEVILLVTLKWVCPLTYLARRYSDSKKENFDIYLPNWLAKYNKLIYSILFFTLVVIYVYKIWQ